LSTATPAQDPTTAIARVVLDTNASLALFAYADAGCAALLAALQARQLQAVANAATRAEWCQVLQRFELRLPPERRSSAAQAFDRLVITLSGNGDASARVTLPRCRDPDDQIFLELARDSGAAVLYSRDRELLKLSRQTQRRAGFVVLRPQDYRA